MPWLAPVTMATCSFSDRSTITPPPDSSCVLRVAHESWQLDEMVSLNIWAGAKSVWIRDLMPLETMWTPPVS
jgi:hypothetical protein